ncbi:hypothetical protein ABIE49_003875 [Bradyrhizobium sp. OAE829]
MSAWENWEVRTCNREVGFALNSKAIGMPQTSPHQTSSASLSYIVSAQ